MLVILDGWGIGPQHESNPIFAAKPENIKFIEEHFPAGKLQASGIAVGLPWDEAGNSEIGHLTIGAGRVFYQHYPRITLSIENGEFFDNPVLKKAFAHAKQNNSSVHLVGLIGTGVVHSALNHLNALIKMAREEKCENLFIHAFTDGRDSAPKSAVDILESVEKTINGIGSIASVMGRSFAMDRDKQWAKTEKAYNALVNPVTVDLLREGIGTTYEKGLNDEFVEPFAITNNVHPIEDNDAIIFFNFREDRMRQIAKAFIDNSFSEFPTKKLKNVFIVTMTEYEKGLNTENVVLKQETAKETLGKTLAENGKTQLRIAETEKYAHVTYFFNGLKEQANQNEFRIIIPSKTVARQEEHPEMMASEITDRAILALNGGGFDFILVNYANTDIIAHTGKYDATMKAVLEVDKAIGRLLKSALAGNHMLFITADHGNAESVLNLGTGGEETKHDSSPVPFYVVANEYETKKTDSYPINLPTVGMLSDIAPTILAMMGMKKPEEMSGQNIFDQLV